MSHARADDDEGRSRARVHPPATLLAPEVMLHQFRPKEEGVGNAGRASRTRSLACERYEHTSKSPRVAGITRHSRTRMVLTVSFVLSPVIGLCCHRYLADTSAKLDISVEISGPHDFAVRD
jgi:hypothetical protein